MPTIEDQKKIPEAPANIPVTTRPIEAHTVKKGMYVMIKGKPCKILTVQTMKG